MYFRGFNLTVASVLLLVGGLSAFAASTLDDGQTVIRLGFMVVSIICPGLAGALFSVIVAVSSGRKEAREEIEEKLDSISRNLAQIHIRIMEAVEQGQFGASTPEATLALINQSAGQLNGLIAEIQAMRGAAFEGKDLVATKKALEDLQNEMNRNALDRDEENSAAIVRKFRNLASKVPIDQSMKTRTSVQCPYCHARNQLSLGLEAGSTAMGICRSCKNRFNAHRSVEGSAFTRPANPSSSSTPPVTSYSHECPNCKRRLTFREPPEGSGQVVKPIVCTECIHRIDISFPRRVIVNYRPLEVSNVAMVGRSGPQPLVKCPDDEEELRAFLRIGKENGDEYHAFCSMHDRLLRVTTDEYWAFLEENDPEYASHRRSLATGVELRAEEGQAGMRIEEGEGP